MPGTATATAGTGGAEPDLAYGAFQRGRFLTAFGLATHRAEAGDMKAMTLLGELYANGLGVPQNDAKADEWYRLAAARGDREAMFALAMFRLRGRAGPRDRDAAAKWFAAAAKLGQPLAAYNLALLYIEGQLFPQDFKRAAELLRVAARAGNPEAQYALGTFYKEGRGVDKGHARGGAAVGPGRARRRHRRAGRICDRAVQRRRRRQERSRPPRPVFRKAALHGSAIAQDRLARILAEGRGAPKNPVEATKWHLISKARGETDLLLDDFVDGLDRHPRRRRESRQALARRAEEAEVVIFYTNRHIFRLVMPALVAGIHVLKRKSDQRRGWPEQVRPFLLEIIAVFWIVPH